MGRGKTLAKARRGGVKTVIWGEKKKTQVPVQKKKEKTEEEEKTKLNRKKPLKKTGKFDWRQNWSRYRRNSGTTTRERIRQQISQGNTPGRKKKKRDQLGSRFVTPSTGNAEG